MAKRLLDKSEYLFSPGDPYVGSIEVFGQYRHEQLLSVTNVTRGNTVLFLSFDPDLGSTYLRTTDSSVFYLATSTVGSLSSDDLQVFLEDANGCIPVDPSAGIPRQSSISSLTLSELLTEVALPLVSCRKFSCLPVNGQEVRVATVAGRTISTQHFLRVAAGSEYYEDGVIFTGSYYFSTDYIPERLVANCATTDRSSDVVASDLTGVVIGQRITGVGIPSNCYVGSISADKTSLGLVDAQGASLMATATGISDLRCFGVVLAIVAWT